MEVVWIQLWIAHDSHRGIGTNLAAEFAEFRILTGLALLMFQCSRGGQLGCLDQLHNRRTFAR